MSIKNQNLFIFYNIKMKRTAKTGKIKQNV